MESNLILFILLFPASAALIVYFAGLKYKQHVKLMTAGFCLVELAAIMALAPSTGGLDISLYMPHIMGTGLYIKMDMFRYIFVCMSSFIWLLAAIYSIWHFRQDSKPARFSIYFLVTLSAVMGVFTSESLLNLFTFFEIMALTSYVLVIHSESKKAHEAGKLYLIISIVTGMITLMGIFIVYEYTGELSISRLPQAVAEMGQIKYAAMLLMGCSFAAKACMFPLHIWLSKTYSESPVPATAVFSAILAKTGFFGIIIIGYIMSWDNAFGISLMALALSSMLLGGFLALMHIEVKKILAYSSMSQIGYMLLSVASAGLAATHADAAVSAGIYHAVNHALVKTLLFMAAGVMIADAGSDNLNSVGASAKSNMLKMLLIIGILSNMGMPGFGGFAGKTLIHHAIGGIFVSHMPGVKAIAECAYWVSSALTVAYSIKLYLALFPRTEKKNFKSMETGSIAAYTPMLVVAGVIALASMMPQAAIHMISVGAGLLFENPSTEHAQFYTFDSLKSSAISMLLGVALYRLAAAKLLVKADGGALCYIDIANKWPGLEKSFYLPLFGAVFGALKKIFGFLDVFITVAAENVSEGFRNICSMEIRTREDKPESGEESNLHLNLSQVTRKLVVRMESVNYSVFLTASILLFLMFSLIRK
ncbi:Na(+)/H(+) antiporter subunit A (plasmid) [Peptoclostridium acidaminophilum DSM 3953]|uniref:Na(+)/H(+) antiporter subunit A n=1 Tax=Peptoclostridium acidaminophilum DSM 3953 TaxID=1286171 RepID=W8T7X3_PEPAC|nr:proton-conducting transporter membrane subunit [Peptoclostridium acidaminophilum]AHM57829.1 Na(+)/H(+) antiporter subunit A [Peptoclostridium acidaminophilum DSM 3953]